MSHDEYATEPVPGLPENLPDDEHLIWQGQPTWRALAVRAFHVRKLVVYFVALWAAFALYYVFQGQYAVIATVALRLVIPLVLGVAVLCGLAALYARMTIYTITNRRVVIRSGVALPISVNVPFAQVLSAGSFHHSDETSDIALEVAADQNASYVVLWPNVRPRYFRRPQPMMRGVADGRRAADLLAGVLKEFVATDDDDDELPRIDVASADQAESTEDRPPQRATA